MSDETKTTNEESSSFWSKCVPSKKVMKISGYVAAGAAVIAGGVYAGMKVFGGAVVEEA